MKTLKSCADGLSSCLSCLALFSRLHTPVSEYQPSTQIYIKGPRAKPWLFLGSGLGIGSRKVSQENHGHQTLMGHRWASEVTGKWDWEMQRAQHTLGRPGTHSSDQNGKCDTEAQAPEQGSTRRP